MNPLLVLAGITAVTAFSTSPVRADDPLPPGHPPVASGGISLPGEVRLHGRFDVAYERHSYSDDLTEGKDAFRNYHRFLFVERRAKDDPFYFNAEVLGLNFYEIGLRLHGSREDKWSFSAAAGKVLVPFGSEPLFHHAYGGRIGQDQRFLPIVWGEFGVKAALDLDLAPVGLRIDAYAVRGYAARNATANINLQTSMAPQDDLNFSGGGRISASLGPATVHYSVYGGTLDFDRSLFMQAFDVSFWRLPFPVLEDIAVTFGVVRADVWGGGTPAYYDFADYLQIRWYPTDCFFIQYRGGLDMRDNRKGLFADGDRLDKLDTSAHSVAVGWNRGNFTLTVQHHWQLELVDEQDDDFFRVTATYEF
jgi:hypothetical protein